MLRIASRVISPVRRLAGVLLLCYLAIAQGASSPLVARFVDAQGSVDILASALAASSRSTLEALDRLGFAAVASELKSDADVPSKAFSSEVVLTSLYSRAERNKRGEGARFLAVVYADAAANSAAMATDARFAWARRYRSDQLDLAKHPIVFARPDQAHETIARPPAHIATAVEYLARYFGSGGLPGAQHAILRNMRRPGFDARRLEQVLFESTSSKAALQRLLAVGTPPPDPRAALRGLFFDTIAESAALKLDPAAWRIVEKLSSQLSPESQSLARAEASLPSFREQVESINAAKREWRDSSRGAFEVDPRDKAYAEEKFEESWRKPAEEELARRAQERDTHERARGTESSTRSRPIRRPQPRSRGKGVSIGDEVTLTFDRTPTAAFFVVNKRNDRFGRVFVLLASSDGKPDEVAYSRELYTDSFAAALELVNDPSLPDDAMASHWRYLVDLDFATKRMLIAHGATRRPLLELMSVLNKDPMWELVYRKLFDEMRVEIEVAASGDHSGTRSSDRPRFESRDFLDSRVGSALTADPRLMDIQAYTKAYPKALLDLAVHPALVGRQVAWSVCRVDFAFLRPAQLLKDVAVLTGNGRAPFEARSISLADASIWEFHERPASLSLSRVGPALYRIGVRHPDPKRPAQSSRLWLALVKKPGKSPPTPPLGTLGDFEHLDRAEELAIPAVEWLFRRHPDFVRVNDLVESSELLRWLKPHHPPLWLVDLDGPGPAVPTPRSFRPDKGPQVARDR